MRDFRDSKAMAKTLRDALAAKSVTISHSEGLELISKAFGIEDWNTLSAFIDKAEQMTAAPPAAPAQSSRLSTLMVRPFVPGGPDYEASKAFYAALGFEMTFDAGTVSGWRCDSGWFLLQNAQFEGWNDNFMMQLVVNDLDAWWEHIRSLDLAARFGVRAPTAPELQPWGLTICYVVSPSGTLWHVTQNNTAG